MNKRSSTRYLVDLKALVHPKQGRSWLCQIQDFCDGGMLLVEQNGRPRRNLPGIAVGEAVSIHFSLPGNQKNQSFKLDGKIVRTMDTGVGINFPEGMGSEALDALSEFSGMKPVPENAPAAKPSGGSDEQGKQKDQKVADEPVQELDFRASGLKPEDAKRIIAELRKELTSVIPEMARRIFKYLDDELLDMAKDAKSNAEQSEYFASMSALEKSKKDVAQGFANDVLNQIDEPRDLQSILDARKQAEEERKAQSAKRVKLSLVNTEDFEDWLAVANLITRSERMYEGAQTQLLHDMGMIVDSWGHAEANPLCTSVIVRALDDAFSKVDLTKEIREKFYDGLESKVLPQFRGLYNNATKLLDESGLFPEMDDDYVSPSSADGGGATATEEEPSDQAVEELVEDEEEEFEELIDLNDEEPVEAEDDDDNDFDVEDEDEIEAEQPPVAQERQPRSSRRRSSRSRRRDSGVAQTTGGQAPRKKRADDVGEAIKNIYQSVRDLIGAKDGIEPAYEEDDEFFEEGEIVDLLGALEGEVAEYTGGRMPVRERFMETASMMGSRQVSPQTLQQMEVVENLVDTIEEDEMLAPSAKDWIRQLELTLNRVATTSDNFLSEQNPHPSIKLVNELARLGGTEGGAAKRVVDEVIHDVNENFDEDPQVFDRALERIEPIVERQNRAFTGNVQRTVKASEGQQTLVNAQRAVVTEMDSRYAGREIPEVLYKLLMPGWRNLLVNTHLREGQDSATWRKHVRAMDQVFQHLDPDADPSASPHYLPPEELIQHIEESLSSISYEPGQRIPLINSLRQVVNGDLKAEDMPTVPLGQQTIAENLGFADVSKVEDTREKIREENESDHRWRRSFDRAQLLHTGAWVEFLKIGEDPDVAIVAWTNDEATRFVFVNRRGVKTHDLTVEEFALMMMQGSVRILEESDIPITERASHRMLQKMHNQLTHQATHDALTGLMNRKEYERQLELAIQQAKRKEGLILCAYLDLDQFKVINNTGGHAAGDQLLVQLARLLEDVLEDADAYIARLSGDEFGILVSDCERERGMQMLKQVAEAVKAVRFDWEGQTFSLTTSCGVYFASALTESAAKAMSSADSACIVAKEGGRDRIHEFLEDDEEMVRRRGVMEFVSHIDKALDEDRFELNVQMIKPIDPAVDDIHYEILLTVLDENDNPMPPQDFIIAAEKFNRMASLDRWVIRNAFKFIASNILKLDHLGAFSINISGNSLTDEGFMDFVLKQFDETGLPTSKITFEITETAAIGSMEDVIEFMEQMKLVGLKFSLDDFGTGLSSYSYLKSLPVDYLKIDGVFIRDIKNNPSDYAVVKSINEVGQFMGKKTIAEFVEDEEIVEILREIGVDYAQGWGIGKKVPITTLLE